jgi:AcrR family transcriptional regulator
MNAPHHRSRATQSRILAAGRALFARDGYERTTIRAVASAAQVDPSLVMRYFGSKDGLFAAATPFDLRLPQFDGIATDQIGSAMVRHFLTRWEGDPEDQSLRILLRAGVNNPDAATRIRCLFSEQVLPVVHRVAPDKPEVRAGLVATQILGLAVCRYILLIPPLAELPPDSLITCIAPTLQRYLTGSLDLNTLHEALP